MKGQRRRLGALQRYELGEVEHHFRVGSCCPLKFTTTSFSLSRRLWRLRQQTRRGGRSTLTYPRVTRSLSLVSVHSTECAKLHAVNKTRTAVNSTLRHFDSRRGKKKHPFLELRCLSLRRVACLWMKSE